MTYRFKLQEPIAEGVRRIGLEQIEIAQTKLATTDDIPTAIHDARRSLKRLRALIRLIRPALGDAAYRRESTRIGDIAKLLSGARDLHVMQQTALKLESRFGASGRLQQLLTDGAGLGAKRTVAAERRQARARLEQAQKFFARADHKHIRFEHLADGLERAYGKARRAFRKAYRRPADEAFHAWRKTVQLHWRQMLLLSRGWPDALGARASEAKELSQLLGEDHDFSVLLAFAQDHAEPAMSQQDLAQLAELCRACQTEIRLRAKPHGARLFAEPSDNLSARVALYWSSARHLAQHAPPEADGESGRRATAVKRPPGRRRAGPARAPASPTRQRSRKRP